MDKKKLLCPKCHQGVLMLKYEAKYVYSYFIDSDAPGLNNTANFLPYMYDNREQKESMQYIECNFCKTQYPCYFDLESNQINTKEIERAIHDNNENKY